jgi:hypothetical protein
MLCSKCRKGHVIISDLLSRCDYCAFDYVPDQEVLVTVKLKSWKNLTPYERKSVLYYGAVI